MGMEAEKIYKSQHNFPNRPELNRTFEKIKG